MSRSGYTDDCDDYLALGRYRAQVASSIRGRKGQAFLRELAAAMDAMRDKELIAQELVNEYGDCCTIGVVCKARELDVSEVDPEEPESVGALVGISHQLAAEIAYENDECSRMHKDENGKWRQETPAERWQRMRKWVDSKLAAAHSTDAGKGE